MDQRAAGSWHFQRFPQAKHALEPGERRAAVAIVQTGDDDVRRARGSHLVGAKSPEVAFEIPRPEFARAVVLVLQRRDDLRARRLRAIVQGIDLVQADVDPLPHLRPWVLGGRVSGAEAHHARPEAQLGVRDAAVRRVEHDVLLEAERAAQPLDGGVAVLDIEAPGKYRVSCDVLHAREVCAGARSRSWTNLTCRRGSRARPEAGFVPARSA
jgi:hypothetical protein